MISSKDIDNKKRAVSIVGLGYVGLPLAVALAEHFRVVGFDINSRRVKALASGEDATGEVAADKLLGKNLTFTDDPEMLREAGVYIVAVPTPIDEFLTPDLRPLTCASETVGSKLSHGSVVVYESTVYPGVTEEICLPILERSSGLVAGKDFFVGYSPERINPGDSKHTLETIVKVVSGQTPEVIELLAHIYGRVVKAGIHRAPSIAVAEAAKVIENTQRDLNIALMNELAIIFNRLGLDTREVLQAAETKWNFLPFRPGLVGGHCIGVDPYYLTFKAQAVGIHPQVILAGRRINDSMGQHVAQMAVKKLLQLNQSVDNARVGVLGLTFKENIPDLRNTRVVDIIRELREYGLDVLVNDPLADKEEARQRHGVDLVPMDQFRGLAALIIAVPHSSYSRFTPNEIKTWFLDPARALVLDVKWLFEAEDMTRNGIHYWRL